MKRLAAFLWRYLCSLGSCLYLLTLGMLFPRNRDFLPEICGHFGLAGKKVRPILPEIDWSDLFPDPPETRILEPAAADGNVSLLELLTIVSFVRRFRPAAVFEIGTFDGRTTLNLAANAPPASRILTLDLPPDQADATAYPVGPDDRTLILKPRAGRRFAGSPLAERIVQLYGDSATFDFSPYRSALDLVFVDGAHSYEYVLNDSAVALDLLREGRGVILWHDYAGFEGVTRGLNELLTNDERFSGLRRLRGTSLAFLIRE